MSDGRRPALFRFALLVSLSFISPASGADWPMWRHDANRSATTDEALPDQLSLIWSLQLPALTAAWQEDQRLHYDGGYEPIVSGGLIFIASSRNDSVTACDAATGRERWRFIAGGPVRFAPVAAAGLLYFGADDGCFYCLDQRTGQVIWKFRVAPNERRVLGNGRLTSLWPVRGGAVLRDGRIWFTAGVWPFEGTFLCSFEASGAASAAAPDDAGNPRSIRDSGLPGLTIETLEKITPQGYLAATDAGLCIPCGRSNVMLKDLVSGAVRVPAYSTHGSTNYHVSGMGRFLFHGGMSLDVVAGQTIPLQAASPALTPDAVYFGKDGSAQAYSLRDATPVVTKDRRGNDVTHLELKALWTIPNNLLRTLPPEASDENWLPAHPLAIDLKAGPRLFGHQDQHVFAIDLHDRGDQPAVTTQPTVTWQAEISGTPRTMLAADGRLYIVTREGRIDCFGAAAGSSAANSADVRAAAPEPLPQNTAWAEKTAKILESTGVRDGYCLVVGVGSGGLIDELVRQSSLQIVVTDRNPASIASLRSRLDQYGMYGTRVTGVAGDISSLSLPPYFASLVLAEKLPEAAVTDATFLSSLYQCTRPYGGTWHFPLSEAEHSRMEQAVLTADLAGAQLRRSGDHSQVIRAGSLPGSADWTHEYGDPSNTLMSQDALVRAPLGVLWFGGPSSSGELYYNRHFWGPSLAVVGGRMFVQGPGKLTATDVYTGRILWQIPLEDRTTYRPGRRGNDFEDQIAGFHFLVVDDGIYLVLVDRCVRLDPATGRTLAEFRFPDAADQWGRVRVEGDLLLAELFRETEKLGLQAVELVALNRYSGEPRWRHKAEFSFPVHAVSGDRVFCFDGALEDFYRDWKRKGLVPKAAEKKSLVALDLSTGKELWRVPTEMTVTWLSFSREHNILMTCNQQGMAAHFGGDGYQLWRKDSSAEGFLGHPENLWDKIILWKDQILDQRGPGKAYSIQSGIPIQRPHPITGKEVSWEFTKSGHHCNYAIANPHMMTFRADTAGFCNIEDATTSRLEGYRPGCRNSLIPANGVLNSPNFAEGCICGYPLFTSLALVHLPQAEIWSYSALKLEATGAAIEKLGINFGAPGDRFAADGTFWLGYPNRTGATPDVGLSIEGSPTWFRQHTSLADGAADDWIASSGILNPTRITIPLHRDSPGKYTVRLYFAEPEPGVRVGDRVFSVSLQDQVVLENLDILAETGQILHPLIREFPGVSAHAAIAISFTPGTGQPLLSGVELVAEPAVKSPDF